MCLPITAHPTIRRLLRATQTRRVGVLLCNNNDDEVKNQLLCVPLGFLTVQNVDDGAPLHALNLPWSAAWRLPRQRELVWIKQGGTRGELLSCTETLTPRRFPTTSQIWWFPSSTFAQASCLARHAKLLVMLNRAAVLSV